MKTRTVCGSPNLAPNTVYELRVQAETVLGPGPFSNSTPFTRGGGTKIRLRGGASVRGLEAAYYPRAKRGKFYLFIPFFTRQGAIL